MSTVLCAAYYLIVNCSLLRVHCYDGAWFDLHFHILTNLSSKDALVEIKVIFSEDLYILLGLRPRRVRQSSNRTVQRRSACGRGRLHSASAGAATSQRRRLRTYFLLHVPELYFRYFNFFRRVEAFYLILHIQYACFCTNQSNNICVSFIQGYS